MNTVVNMHLFDQALARGLRTSPTIVRDNDTRLTGLQPITLATQGYDETGYLTPRPKCVSNHLAISIQLINDYHWSFYEPNDVKSPVEIIYPDNVYSSYDESCIARASGIRRLLLSSVDTCQMSPDIIDSILKSYHTHGDLNRLCDDLDAWKKPWNSTNNDGEIWQQ